MRALSLIVVVVAACGGETADEGTVITVRAPDGPATADRLEIILASASAITEIDNQRTAPGTLEQAAARYYQQRSTAGAIADVGALDGFVVRIEANTAESPDRQFIPFLVAETRVDGELRITGIGTVLDDNGDPAPIAITPGKLESYVVDMVPLAGAAPDAPIARGESLTVACDSLRSGIAWQPGDGLQLRLLLPDVPGSDDATARALDMDCDAHDVPDEDCDDLRSLFHAAAAEACDGFDTNCDGARQELMPCQLPAGTCGPTPTEGVALCLDRDGGDLGECTGDPQCLCANGNAGPCTKCILSFEAGASQATSAPCAPATGALTLVECTENSPCVVEVLPGSAPWVATVSIAADGPYLPKVTDVIGAKIHLKVELAGTTEVMGVAASSVGEAFLGVSTANGRRHLGVDLQLSNAGATDCEIGQIQPMLCSP